MVKNDSNVAVANTTRSKERRGVFIQMPEPQHRALKVRAAGDGTTLQNLVSGLLSEALEREDSRGGRRSRNG